MALDNGLLVQWATWAFSPTYSAIIVTVLVSLLLPIFIHWQLYRKASSAVLPCFLLLGPSGGGKTTLLTLFSSGTILPTQTSQEPQTVKCTLAADVDSADDQYRSVNDTSSRSRPRFQLVDTPGHGKLRHHASQVLSSGPSPKGLLFVVDSAAMSSAAGLTEAAEYLHDVLLTLQKRHTTGKSSKDPQAVPVLVLANKQDVFTSLPVGLVQKKLEQEIAKIRTTKSRGLLDSGVAVDSEDSADEQQWLGEFGSKQFAFSQMEEHGVEVIVIGGNAKSSDDKPGKVRDWWKWIGQNV